MQNRRRGDRRRRLLWVFGLVVAFYTSIFVWPTAWRYHQVGHTPMRTNRVTGHVEYLNLQGWQPVLPPLDVGGTVTSRAAPTPGPDQKVGSPAEPAAGQAAQ